MIWKNAWEVEEDEEKDDVAHLVKLSYSFSIYII